MSTSEDTDTSISYESHPTIPKNKQDYHRGFEEFEKRVDEIISQYQSTIEKEMRKLIDSQNMHVNMRDGSRYLGKLVSKKRQGIGQNLFQTGITYRGFFKDDKMEGSGILIKNSRPIFQGNFKENKFEKIGKRIYDNGDVYKGQFKNGTRNGMGIYFFEQGDKYFGHFKNHKKEGTGEALTEGRYLFANGQIYLGNFADDTIEGYGKIFQEGRKVFEGDFRSGKIHGKGKYYFPNGNCFLCHFQENKREGIGRFVIKNPKSGVGQIDSVFKHNELVRVVGVSLVNTDQKNLNLLANQRQVFERSNLMKLSDFEWKSRKALTKKQKSELKGLNEFALRLSRRKKQKRYFELSVTSKETLSNDSEDYKSSDTSKDEDRLEKRKDTSEDSEKTPDLSNSAKDDLSDEENCDNFECPQSNWGNPPSPNCVLCEKCLSKRRVVDQITNEKVIFDNLINRVDIKDLANLPDEFNSEGIIKTLKLDPLNQKAKIGLSQVH